MISLTKEAGKNVGLAKRIIEVLKLALEIERKFLVDKRKLYELNYSSEVKIAQGYLCGKPTVRVRLKENQAFLTIKSSTGGISRQEFEYEIPVADGEEILKLCRRNVLRKIRRTIDYGGHVWEIDFFMGRLAGLVLAEVELTSVDEQIELPDWVIKEVSDDPRYFNSNLVKSDREKLGIKKKIPG